jgi:hypothetical protein
MYATVIPAGTLTIRAASDHSTGCELWLNDDYVGAFPSAAAAAQSVSRHRSGCDLIDDVQAQVPDSIDAWQWISVSSQNAMNQPMFLMGSASEAL